MANCANIKALETKLNYMANVAGWAALGAVVGWIIAWLVRGRLLNNLLTATQLESVRSAMPNWI